ncbi:hypothetical protein ANANG_G00256690 [Anguilla anguilla]|uniref:Uncharacterized protein n=1 Tax=Anguilla anguilla TaxID=7936 RepID=A0A9D3LT54_ANGAN|nr:hypothetical protein ANANG_G00256690 [Anguilla anguilla]
MRGTWHSETSVTKAPLQTLAIHRPLSQDSVQLRMRMHRTIIKISSSSSSCWPKYEVKRFSGWIWSSD